jgi:hypothetical protein
MYPKEPALRVTSRRVGSGTYRIKVTVSVAGVGANEAAVSTEPVYRAAIKLGRVTTYTNNAGIATVVVGREHKLTVTAGDTLKPASARL